MEEKKKKYVNEMTSPCWKQKQRRKKDLKRKYLGLFPERNTGQRTVELEQRECGLPGRDV